MHKTLLRHCVMGLLLSSTTSLSAETQPALWQRLPATVLNGDVPANDHAAEVGLPANYFDELDASNDMQFALLYANRIQTGVVQTSNEITRSFDFPGDETVHLRSGRVILIDEPSGEVHIANAGDYFIVPAHWRGLWLFKNLGTSPAREHAMLSAVDYSSRKPALDRASIPTIRPTPSAIVVNIDEVRRQLRNMDFAKPSVTPSNSNIEGKVIFAGEPSFLMLHTTHATTASRPLSDCESVVRVVSGSVQLEDAHQRRDTFTAEEVFVVKQGFQGQVRFSADFTALAVTSSGSGTPPWPEQALPSVQVCPAF